MSEPDDIDEELIALVKKKLNVDNRIREVKIAIGSAKAHAVGRRQYMNPKEYWALHSELANLQRQSSDIQMRQQELGVQRKALKERTRPLAQEKKQQRANTVERCFVDAARMLLSEAQFREILTIAISASKKEEEDDGS